MSPHTKLFRTILCPVDFSEHSRHALHYAALLASRYRSRLVAIFIEDPMLAAAAAFSLDEKTLVDEGRAQLQRLVEQATRARGVTRKATTIEVTVGRAHEEILRAADRFKCDLIVMGSHGLTGVSRVMFGSTTHRVLRESSLPILATPPAMSSAPLRSWPGKRAIAPVDLGPRDRADALAAATVARELGVRLQLVHVVEPIPDIPWLELDKARRNQTRHRKAVAELAVLQDELAWAVTECHVASGKPADEIAKLASSTAVGLVIMTRRRGQGLFGPKQGSITYQVLTRAKTAVLALPSDRKWLRGALSRAAKP
jgi:universal stress protein A